MNQQDANGLDREKSIMPPLVYETVAWLRLYSWIPFPALPGETAGVTPDPSRSAHAAPIAGAIIGLTAGIVAVVAAALGATSFVAAAAGVLTLTVICGGRAEQALLAAGGPGSAGPDATANVLRIGVVAVAFFAIARVGAVDGLMLRGAWHAAFALAAACAVARAASLAFALLRPAVPGGIAANEPAALQWLAIAGIAIGIVAVFPFFGLAAAIAGIAAAAAAVALVSAFVTRTSSESDRDFLAIAELTAETAFLIAVIAFAGQ
jgi:cobalamin synthase